VNVWFAMYGYIGCENATVTVARSVVLAQARPTRPSETDKGRPRWHSRTLAQAECFCFERGTVSLRWETLA